MSKWFRSVIIFVILSATGCTSFHREWRAALENAPETYTSIEGPWKGSWKVEGSNAHGGSLKCIVSRIEDSDLYGFYYRAHWKKILSGNYRTEFQVRDEGETQTFYGEKDLGRWGGVFTHTGSATPESFKARFDSKGSSGIMELKRPE